MKAIVREKKQLAGLSEVLDALPDLVYLADRDGVIQYANSIFASWFGLTSDECIGKNVYTLLSDNLHQPELAEHQKRLIEEVLNTGLRKVFEDERDTWRVTINPVGQGNGNITSLLVTIQDITSLRQTRKELSHERSLKTALLDAMPCSAVILDEDLHMIVWNRYAEEMLFSDEKSEGRTITANEFFCPDEMGELRKKLKNVILKGEVDSRVLKVHPHGNKHTFWMLTHTSQVFIEGKACALSIGIDISERKHIEEELKKSKSRLDQALTAAQAGIWEWDPVTDDVEWSDEVWKLYGLEAGKAKPTVHLWEKAVHPDDLEPVLQAIRTMGENQADLNLEYRVCHPDGSIRWILSRGKPRYDEHRKIRFAGTVIDITERKQTEQKLIDYQKRFELALKASGTGFYERDLSNDEVVWSETLWTLFGFTPGTQKATFGLWKRIVHPEDLEKTLKYVDEMVAKGGELDHEYRICRPDGSVRWMHSRSTPLLDANGNVLRYVGTNTDITERKEMELELLQSKVRFNYALDASQSGVWEWDVTTDNLSWSEQVWRLYGLEPGCVPLNNQLCVDTVHPDDRAKASWIIKTAVSKGEAASLEYRTVHPDGSIHWLTSRGMPIQDAQGKVVRYIGAIIDITERKKIELELVESNTRLDMALEAARAGVWEWDVKNNINTWSDEAWVLYGLEKNCAEPSFDLWVSTIHPDDRESAIDSVRNASGKGKELYVEYRVNHPDGSIHWLMSRGKPQLNNKSRKVRYIGTVIDITERKTIELALEQSKKRMTFALDATNSGVWEWDVIVDNVTWTDSVWRLYDLEPDSKKTTHKLCETNIHPLDKDITFEKVMSAANHEKPINIEYRVCHKDGSVHWLLCRGVPFYTKEGRMRSYIGTVTDITDRKELLNDLMDSKMRLSQALEAARAGVWEWNLKTGENIWSTETWPLYGLDWRNGEIPSFDLWKSTVHHEDREQTVQAVTRASKAKTELYVEYRVEHPDGSVHWLMSRGRPLYNNHGKVDRYLGTVIDITNRKKIEEELQKNREKLDFILKKSHVGVWDLNLQNYHVERSAEHAHIFGDDYEQSAWSLERFLNHVAPEDRARIQSLITSSILKKESYTFECRIYRPNGEMRWIWVTGTCQPDVNDNSMHVLGIVQDITEQKKAEAAVRANESKFRNIFDHSPVAIGIGDVDKGILYDVNNAMLELFGLDREEIIGRSISEVGIIMNHEDDEQIMRELNGCRKIINAPFHFRKKSGEILNILFSAEYITINDRQALLVMMTDITLQEVQQMSIEKLEQAVAERTGQLNEEVNRLHSFLSMITHEYRTPLAIIRGNLDLIELKNKRCDCVNPVETGKIHRAIDRLVDLMEESIHESRVLESRTEIAFKAFRISQVIDTQLESFKSLWADIPVIYSNSLENSRISGDFTQFGLAIYNLLDNARKYSPPESPIELECRQDGHEAVIMIRNLGKSITEEQAAAFFEKYRRGSNSMNTSGAGIGLWLVKNIIEQHKGTVNLKGIPTGVEAVVRLPLYEKDGAFHRN
jgi:PAS domain S-box-containing protein